jgi:threonine aldolase
MIFASDNWAGAHPKISEALGRAAGGFAPAYGNSPLDRRVEERFSEIFERDVAVFFVATGTAANALALTAVNKPGGVAFAQAEAHLVEDECGAPEYYTGGARVHRVPGRDGRLNPDELRRALEKYPDGSVHTGQPMAVSITQATEVGTVYAIEAIGEVASIAGPRGLPLHMDGARFANALVSLGAKPAEMSWKAGVDILSFGGTKNGCWCAEALVFFDPDRAKAMPYLRKRAAQLFSKSRFVAAQFEAYLADGLWLELAGHANQMANALADILSSAPGMRLAWRPEANEVFAVMPRAAFDRLQGAGARFYEWPWSEARRDEAEPDRVLCRFVTSFATTRQDLDEFARLTGA